MKIETISLIIDTMNSSISSFEAEISKKIDRSFKLQRLYTGIKSKIILNDSSAAQYIYDEVVPPSRTTELKNRLYDNLIEAISCTTPQATICTELQLRYLSCLRQYYAAQVLTFISYSGTLKAIILEKIFKKAQKYEFSDLAY